MHHRLQQWKFDNGHKMSQRAAPLLFVVLTVAVVLGGCKAEPPMKPIRPVKTMIVGDVAAVSGRMLSGRAKATEEVNLSFRVSGPLVSLPVDVGTVVKKGDVVAQIDPRDFSLALDNARANLAQAEANLDAMKIGARPEEILRLKSDVQRAEAKKTRADSDFGRAKKLIVDKVISQEEYDLRQQLVQQAEAELTSAKEALHIGESGARVEDIRSKEAEILSLKTAVASAQDQLNYTSLRAPFAGTIAAKYVENFQTVQAKERIVRLLDTSKIEMIVDLPESIISIVQYAKDIVCTFDAFPLNELPATIKEIGTEASATTRTYPVTLIMDQPSDIKILPGMAGVARGRVELPANIAQKGFEVPGDAVFSDDNNKQYVWVVEADGKGVATVKRLQITVGDLTPRGVRVKGVAPGTTIVTAGVHYLMEGQKVRVLRDSLTEDTNTSAKE